MDFKTGLFVRRLPVSSATDLTLRIQRDVDHWFLDFNDGTFYASAHTFVAIDVAMVEPDPVHAPGWYMYSIPSGTLATWNDGSYTIYVNNGGALAIPSWSDIIEITLPEDNRIIDGVLTTTEILKRTHALVSGNGSTRAGDIITYKDADGNNFLRHDINDTSVTTTLV